MKLFPEQQQAVTDIIDVWENLKYCYLNGKTGSGKTAISISAVAQHARKLGRNLEQLIIIVVAPLGTHRTGWLSDLKALAPEFTVKEYKKNKKFSAGINLINAESLSGLKSNIIIGDLKRLKKSVDYLIIDEITAFMNSQSKRSKAGLKLSEFCTYRIGMTATPIGNNYANLYGQVKVLDYGETFGKSKTLFMSEYFTMIMVFNYVKFNLKPGAGEEIGSMIEPFYVYADSPKDDSYDSEVIYGSFGGEVRKTYEEAEKQVYIAYKESLVTRKGLSGRLAVARQICSGFKYIDRLEPGDKKPSSREVKHLNDVKCSMLQDYLQDLGDEKCIVLYYFQADEDRIIQELGYRDLKYTSVKGGSSKKRKDAIDTFTSGDPKSAQICLLQGGSGTQGLNLHFKCNRLLWYSLTYNAIDYVQGIGRVVGRIGQEKKPQVSHFIIKNTIDEDIYKSVTKKQDVEACFRERMGEA